MRILAIRGRNLASLEGNFATDFTMEPLASAGIFAISGPTGAGKSTLLDAMCLALFSKTPRTEQARERLGRRHLPKPALSKGCADREAALTGRKKGGCRKFPDSPSFYKR